MPSQEDINHQLKLLGIHRRNLEQYLKQRAMQGGAAFALPMVTNGIREERENIRRIKAILRGWNVPVDSHPDDEEPPAEVLSTSASATQQSSATTASESSTPTSVAKPQSEAAVTSASSDNTIADVFISYHKADEDSVFDELLPLLENAGLKVIIGYRDFEIGVPRLVNIERAVQNSRHTLIVMTPDWVAGEWENFESLLVQTDNPTGIRRKLIPLMYKPCKPPARIALLDAADLTRPKFRSMQLDKLVKSLR
jgi:hypothetical protein